MREETLIDNVTKEERKLFKYIVASTFFFFVGTVHGVLQILPPIRAYLDSIGSPYGGPGHMIDPLAHAHINVIGGVVLLCMAVSYYLVPRLTGVKLYSTRLINYTFWFTALGITGFYSTLLGFGIVEGNLLLAGQTEQLEVVHSYYKPTIAIVSFIMGMGFWIFFANVFMTAKKVYRTWREEN
ncbi:MAG: cytochrome oxidase [Gammaproteobacteria bacterium]|nr:cytochrome oxidase [Gammaproteobacteria bacterium]